MLFHSYVFILFFLPCTIALYYLLNDMNHNKGAKVALLAMSLWFCAYYSVSCLFLLLGSIAWNYCASRLLCADKAGAGGQSAVPGDGKASADGCFAASGRRKAVLTLGICGNLALLFYFKYTSFFLENINALFHTSLSVKKLILPLGISFLTFQQIAYLVDSYRGETRGYGLLDYSLFVAFFPKLASGPIVTHGQLLPQFGQPERRRFDEQYFALGLRSFCAGLSKKVLLADVLGVGADWGFANAASLTGADVVLTSLLYTFQLYFDFSGYCDMACGIAKMLHLDLPANFELPYRSLSIAEFWRRWHMTLGGFLRKYIYIPLGGNRRGLLRTLGNTMAVFLISGIWHGANWTFVFWGFLHGAASVFYRLVGKQWDRLPRIVRLLVNFAFVNVAWLLFRSASVSEFFTLLERLFAGGYAGVSRGLLDCFDILELNYLETHIGALGRLTARYPGIYMTLFLAVAALLSLLPKKGLEGTDSMKRSVGGAVLCSVGLFWSVLSLSGMTTFLYFGF